MTEIIETTAAYIKKIYYDNRDNNKSIGPSKVVRDHQFFAACQFVFGMLTNSMLFFHSTGTGKTITACYVIKLLKVLYPEWTIFILVKAALHDTPWQTSLTTLELKHQYVFVLNYDDAGFPQKFHVIQTSVKPNSRVLIIIDEAHDFISRIVPKIEVSKERPLRKVVAIIKRFMSNTANKLLLLSATPFINSHREFIYMMDLMAPHKLPPVDDFERIFLYKGTLINTSLLQQLIAGLVSVYTLSPISSVFEDTKPTNSNFAYSVNHIVSCQMSPVQESLYKDAIKMATKNDDKDMFFNVGRSCCKFIYNTPRKRLRAFETETQYHTYLQNFVAMFNKETHNMDINNTAKELLKLRAGMDTIKSTSVYNVLSKIGNQSIQMLFESSCKYFNLVRMIMSSRGKCLIFEQLIKAEGITILSSYLRIFGITFMEYSGMTSDDGRKELKRIFDDKNNIHGQVLKCVIISKAGAEGIEFTNITDIYFTDMSWTDAKLKQSVGRGIRDSSHNDLPISERYVDVWFLLAHIDDFVTADDSMFEIVCRKGLILNRLMSMMHKASIESLYNTKTNKNPDDAPRIFNLDFNYIYEIYVASIKKYMLNILKNKKLVQIFFSFNINAGIKHVDVCYYDKSTANLYILVDNIYIKIGILKKPINTVIMSSNNGISKMLVYEAISSISDTTDEQVLDPDNTREEIRSIVTNPSIH